MARLIGGRCMGRCWGGRDIREGLEMENGGGWEYACGLGRGLIQRKVDIRMG